MATDTKDALLDAAEALFAERGLQRTSLRAITHRARANLASVNYHFGSKDALVRAVLDRRIGPMNEERLRLLNAYEAEAGAQPLALEQVLRAFVAPAFQLSESNAHEFAALLSRLHFSHDPEILGLLQENFEQVLERFFTALRSCLPELTSTELFLRLHFAIGAMAHTVVNRRSVPKMSKGLVPEVPIEGLIELLVAFLAAGFRAQRVRHEQATMAATAVESGS